LTIAIDFEAHERAIQAITGQFGKVLYDAGKEAEPATRDLLRKMLLSNFDELMGDKSSNKYRPRTGHMRSIIGQSGVTIWMTYNNPRILYWLPPSAEKYENSPSTFFRVFSSLAYGAVRNTGASRKTRRAVKRAALKNEGLHAEKNKRGKFRFQGYETEITGSTTRSIRLTARRAVDDKNIQTETSVVVIKPRNFWPLSSGEESQLSYFAMEEITKAIQRRR